MTEIYFFLPFYMYLYVGKISITKNSKPDILHVALFMKAD